MSTSCVLASVRPTCAVRAGQGMIQNSSVLSGHTILSGAVGVGMSPGHRERTMHPPPSHAQSFGRWGKATIAGGDNAPLIAHRVGRCTPQRVQVTVGCSKHVAKSRCAQIRATASCATAGTRGGKSHGVLHQQQTLCSLPLTMVRSEYPGLPLLPFDQKVITEHTKCGHVGQPRSGAKPPTT